MSHHRNIGLFPLIIFYRQKCLRPLWKNLLPFPGVINSGQKRAMRHQTRTNVTVGALSLALSMFPHYRTILDFVHLTT